jgi:hypothetical protein
MWRANLSVPLPVAALVSHYLTNKLIGREAIPKQRTISSTDHVVQRGYSVLIRVSPGYPGLRGRFLTCYAPVRRFPQPDLTERLVLPRLACIKRTANVRPEPGSNSPSKFFDENDPVSMPKHRPGVFFIPQKDEAMRGRILFMHDPAVIRGRVLYVYNRWLVRPSFLPPKRSV